MQQAPKFVQVLRYNEYDLQAWEASTKTSSDPDVVAPATASSYRKNQKVFIRESIPGKVGTTPWDVRSFGTGTFVPKYYQDIPKP
jgi:hypothetical protein